MNIHVSQHYDDRLYLKLPEDINGHIREECNKNNFIYGKMVGIISN